MNGKWRSCQVLSRNRDRLSCDAAPRHLMPEFKVTKLPRKEPGKLGRPKIHPVVDLTGKRFGSWTLLLCTTPGKGMTETRYVCRCDCGYQEEKQIHNILQGESESCKQNCGRGRQIREYGVLESGLTPGSKPSNVERWQRTLAARAEYREYTARESDSLLANDSQ